MIRIASIDNLSACAFRLSKPRPWGVAAFFCPARVHTLTLTESCDASLLPTASLAELSDRVEPVGHYGIACRGPVGSVVLQLRIPLEELLDRGLPIGVTAQTKSSRRLLIQLCRATFNRTPVLTPLDQSPYARLLIGNDAYRAANSTTADWETIDLCDWWYRTTGRPFVFARWVVRRDLDAAARRCVQKWLDACVDEAETTTGITRMASMNNHLFKAPEEAARYYAELRHRLTREDLEAIDCFELNMEGLECLSA